jgi:hypothetical protein
MTLTAEQQAEAMAILREIAEGDPLIDDYAPKLIRLCRYCGLALVSEHYEFPPFRRVHADDCLYVRVKALVEGA